MSHVKLRGIVKGTPPLFDEIDAAFHVKGKPVVFAWGDIIFNPMGGEVTNELACHELVHCRQQAGDPTSWWRRYIAEPKFRLEQEIPAYQVQYGEYCLHNPAGKIRNNRRLYLDKVARDLSSPLYGRLVTYERARALIKAAA